MKEQIIRLSELMEYHQVKEVYRNRIACFRMDNRLVNIDTIPPAFADIFSFVLVQKGTAVFSLNCRERTVCPGDLLLFWPSLLVSLNCQSDDFTALHLLCERELFEHLLSTRPAYQTYSLFFCQTDFPVLRLSDADAEALARSMEEISRHILRPGNYQEDILHHLLHTCLLQVLELIEGQTPTRPAALTHAEVLFQRFITLLTRHYKEEHCIAFYANSLSVSTTYLSRVIRQTTQKTAGYFITGLLYAEACRLLRTPTSAYKPLPSACTSPTSRHSASSSKPTPACRPSSSGPTGSAARRALLRKQSNRLSRQQKINFLRYNERKKA